MLLGLISNAKLYCSRLSDNAAPDAPELRTPLYVRDGDDDLPSSQRNGDAGNHLGNPDIQVPEYIERNDGLGARGKEEKEGQNADREKKERKETEDERRIGNNKVFPETTGQPWEKKRVETRARRHVPGGTWLTKHTIKGFQAQNQNVFYWECDDA
ncbi:hypothetical protein NDU88_002854 [Pleurodeles waltl]|uniref:Uncharacterized protein n=1 Tax=Pleurodeles waltl TaxID=8319 RepID=A0AAV7WR36_PLEWA|nr:hypothetical protein NDU88_002854 [Pleurodeles waltl]